MPFDISYSMNGYKYRTLLLWILFRASKNSIYSNGNKYQQTSCVCARASVLVACEALSWLMNVWLFKSDIKNPRHIERAHTHTSKHMAVRNSHRVHHRVQCACEDSIFFSLAILNANLYVLLFRTCVRSLYAINKLHVFHSTRTTAGLL